MFSLTLKNIHKNQNNLKKTYIKKKSLNYIYNYLYLSFLFTGIFFNFIIFLFYDSDKKLLELNV
jgi:hypothetical protein